MTAAGMQRRAAPRWQLAVVAAAALLIGVLGSWRPSLWNDEGVTISAASRSLPQIWELTGRIDAVHAVYYSLLSPWVDVFGASPLVVRLPSALLVAATTWVLVRLVEHWVPAREALTAGAVFAVLPRSTWMAIEARPWALATFLAVLATLLLVRWVERGRWLDLAGYALVLGLGIAVELYLVFLAAAQLVSMALLWWRRRGGGTRGVPVRRLLGGAGAMVVAGLVASPIVLRAVGQRDQIASRPLSVVRWARQLLVNQNFSGEPIGPAGWLDHLWQPAAVAMALVGWALVVLLVWRALRGRDEGLVGLVAWSLPWLVLPSVLVAGWSLLAGNMYNPRYFSVGAPALAALVGPALGLLAGRWRTAVIAALVVLMIPGWLAQRTELAKSGSDWSGVAAFVAEHARPGDGVYFAPKPATRLIAISYPDSFTGLVDLTLRDGPDTTATLAGTDRPLAPVLVTAPDRVWAIWRSDDADLERELGVFLNAGYRQESRWSSTLDTVVGLRRG